MASEFISTELHAGSNYIMARLGGIRVLPLIGIAIATILCYFAATGFYNLFLHPLRRIPGPRWNAAYGIARFRMTASGNTHHTLLALHNKYGDVVRVAPDEVSFSGPRAWHDIDGLVRAPKSAGNASGYVENSKESVFYRYLTTPASIIHMPQDVHTRARRILAPAFSAKAVADQEPFVSRHIDQLIHLLATAAGAEEPVDMVRLFNWTTFDIIGDLGFGEPFGCLREGKDHEWVNLLFGSVKISALMVSAHRLLGSATAGLIAAALSSPDLQAKKEWHRAQTRDKVARRTLLGASRPDFMSPMLVPKPITTDGDGDVRQETALSPDQIQGTTSTFIVAGSETSATTLSAIVYFLTSAPDAGQPGSALARVRDEVRRAFAAESEITFATARNLAFLGAVVDESLRLHPPVATGFPRQAHAGGAEICGYFVPEGTILGISQWAMYRNPNNFTLPEEFIPDRWLGTDARFADDHFDAFQPFSYGSRNCIGRFLAVAEIRTILARTLWRFDLELCPESLTWQEDQKSYALWEKGPLKVIAKPRK